MSKIWVHLEAELENENDALIARDCIVEVLENVSPYMFDNVIVTSNVGDEES